MIALVIAVFLSVTSCTKKPVMQIHEAHVAGVSLTGLVVNVVVKVTNSNSFDIEVRHIRAQTTLAGSYQLPPIDFSPNVWLNAKGTTYMTMPVTIPWTMVPGILSATLGSEYIRYTVQGYADVTASRSMGFKVNNESVQDEGVISRQMMLQAASPKLPGLR